MRRSKDREWCTSAIYSLPLLEPLSSAKPSSWMQCYHIRFRGERWWIGANGSWHTANRDLEAAKGLAMAIARRAAELGLATSVVVHHKDGTEEVVWDGSHG